MGRAARVVLVLLCAPGACQIASAAGWRLSGPDRPPAGETATFVLRGPPGQGYRVAVLAGARECPGDQLPAHPAQKLETGGFLDTSGRNVRQLSFESGHSTICAYDADTAAVVADKAVRTSHGRDRLNVTAAPKQSSAAIASLTAAGYVGRDGDPTFADPDVQHVGTVLVTAVRPSARCPDRPPDPHAPRSGMHAVDAAHFSVDVTIVGAFELARRPRLCAYLTARRRAVSGVGTRVVARAQTRLAAAIDDPASGGSDHSGGLIGGILAWLFAGLLVAAVAAIVRFTRPRRPASRTTQARSGPGPAPDSAPAEPHETDTSQGYEFVQRRLDEEVGFAIQRAVGATADVFRDRLRLILEQRDGADWLDALNRRRRADILANGHGPPAPYASFEPRAVLNCLAHDPAALQLIGLDAADAARKLGGLANAAHHPDPDNPLTHSDYQRAWHLYSQITGYAAPFDRYER